MARLYLIRHGKAAAGWDADPDPGLDETGRAQAEAAAEKLAPLGPLPIISSPLRRTRETAVPFERRWGGTVRIEPAVGEIASPVADLSKRGEWLRGVMRSRWPELDPWLPAWRDTVAAALLAVEADTVVVSHFVAINAAVAVATGDERVLVFRPDNGSCTIIETGPGRLSLIELGSEGETRVL